MYISKLAKTWMSLSNTWESRKMVHGLRQVFLRRRILQWMWNDILKVEDSYVYILLVRREGDVHTLFISLLNNLLFELFDGHAFSNDGV